MITEPLTVAILYAFEIWRRRKEKEKEKKMEQNIAIFGSKGAGKTTLWEQLQGIFTGSNYHPTMGVEDINQFSIEYNGLKKVISKAKDYGGDDNLVKDYGEIIKEGTLIYYLIDLTRLQLFKKETRARLQALSNVIRQKQIGGKVKLSLVATHYGEYQKLNSENTRFKAKNEIENGIGLREIQDFNIEYTIMVAELRDEEDIKQFYEQITN